MIALPNAALASTGQFGELSESGVKFAVKRGPTLPRFAHLQP